MTVITLVSSQLTLQFQRPTDYRYNVKINSPVKRPKLSQENRSLPETQKHVGKYVSWVKSLKVK
jgi:hypothetical protein